MPPGRFSDSDSNGQMTCTTRMMRKRQYDFQQPSSVYTSCALAFGWSNKRCRAFIEAFCMSFFHALSNKKALPWEKTHTHTRQDNKKSKTKLLTMSYLSLNIDICESIIKISILRLLPGWGIHVPLTIPTPIAPTHSYKFQVGHASCSSSRHLSWAHLKPQDQPKGSWLQTGSKMIADSWNDSSENLRPLLDEFPAASSSNRLQRQMLVGHCLVIWSQECLATAFSVCICMAARATRCQKPHQWRNEAKRAEMPRKLNR